MKRIVIIISGMIMYFVGVICKYLHDDYKQYPNIHVGYKIGSSMKDKETWEEANIYIYKACTMSLIFAVSFMGLTKLMDLQVSNSFYCIGELLTLFGPIVLTEVHLHKFNKYRNVND